MASQEEEVRTSLYVIDEDFYEEQLLENPPPEPSVSPSESYFQCWRCTFKTLDKDGFYSHFQCVHGGLSAPAARLCAPLVDKRPSSSSGEKENRGGGGGGGLHDDVLSKEFLTSSWMQGLTAGNRCLDCGMYYPNILRHVKDEHLNLDNLPPGGGDDDDDDGQDDDQDASSSSFTELPIKQEDVLTPATLQQEQDDEDDEDTLVIISEDVEALNILPDNHRLTQIPTQDENIMQWRIETEMEEEDDDDEEEEEEEEEEAVVDQLQLQPQQLYAIDEHGQLIQLDSDPRLVLQPSTPPPTSSSSFQLEREESRQFRSVELADGSKTFCCNLCPFSTKFGGTIHHHINSSHRGVTQ